MAKIAFEFSLDIFIIIFPLTLNWKILYDRSWPYSKSAVNFETHNQFTVSMALQMAH